MGYAGWKGVTDHLHILIAVSYEPVEGTLACRMNTGEPIIHVGVPERMYQILLHSPFAGSYYRKNIRTRYPCPYADNPPPYKPKENGPSVKRMLLGRKRLEAVTEAKPIQTDLFGEILGGHRQKIKSHSKNM